MMGKLALAQYRAGTRVPPAREKAPRLLSIDEPIPAAKPHALPNGRVCQNCESLLVHGITIDATRGFVTWVGARAALRLPPGQLTLLHSLATKPHTNRQLIHALYGDRADGGPVAAENTLKVFVSKLRQALEYAGFPGRIVTNFGHGYHIDFTPAETPAEAGQPKEKSMGFMDLIPPVDLKAAKVKLSPYKSGKTKLSLTAELLKAAGIKPGSNVRVQVDMLAPVRTLRVFADERGPFTLRGSHGFFVIGNGAFPALAEKTSAEATNNGPHIDIALPEAWQRQKMEEKAAIAVPNSGTTKPGATHPWRQDRNRAA